MDPQRLGNWDHSPPTAGRGLSQSNFGPGDGFNVNNFGQLSVQHAPNCITTRNSNNASFAPCPCMHGNHRFLPSTTVPQNPIGNFGTSFVMPTSIVGLPVLESLPRRSRRHTRYSSTVDERDSFFNMNQMPSIEMCFTRTSPGGLFSKATNEGYDLSIGGGKGEMGSDRERRRRRKFSK